MRNFVTALLLAGFISTSAFAGSREAVKINTRSGVTVDILLKQTDQAKAALILLPGGPGYIDLSGTTINRDRGFFAANFDNFADYDFTVAAVETPSDKAYGMPPRFRQTDAHLRDLDAVISHIKNLTKLPVWLIGISRSTISVLHGAINLSTKINGLVVMSSTTRIPPRSGVTRLTSLALDQITFPALAIGHEDDGCRGTPPEGARQLASAMTNSPKAVAKIFSGGGNPGRNPCGPGSHHTFEGIQDEVVNFIADFIKSNLG
tara:strand:+ start:841 stop:1626 length:786 start_codon:yes stop_codon:yes gene_type:complete